MSAPDDTARSTRSMISRDGITLIIVLGFIAVLVILGVSLSITTRVERLASASYVDTTRARQLVFTALARALDNIDAAMVASNLSYPPSVAFALGATTNVGTTGTNVYGAEGIDFVPDAMYFATNNVRLGDVFAGTTRVGRAGYLAIDCSGLIDANVVGGSSRSSGESARELAMNSTILDEFGDPGQFVARRQSTWRRFESVAELAHLGTNYGALVDIPINLFTYSAFRDDRSPEGTNKVLLGGSDADIIAASNRPQEIINAFVDCGISATVAPALYTNFLDYIDADSIPRSLDSFCTEAVPLINEVVFSNVVARAPDGVGGFNYIHDVYVTVEVWYPFMGYNSQIGNFTVEVPGFTFQVAPATAAFLAPAPTATQQSPQQPPMSPGSFRTVTFKNTATANGPDVGNLGLIATPSGNIRVLGSGGATVFDQVNAASFVGPLRPQWVITPAGNFPAGSSVSLQANDPRLNHLVSSPHWQRYQNGPTLSNMNVAVSGGEGWSPMFVRNNKLDTQDGNFGLGSVADLGFLSIGDPWETVSLYNTPANNLHPVLDYFIVSTQSYVRGKVNVNSPVVPALATVWNDMPLNQYPRGTTLGRINPDAAMLIGTNIFTALRSSPASEFTTNRGISVIGDLNSADFVQIQNAAGINVFTNDAVRESLIRNACQLVGTRQNLFTVFLYGQYITSVGSTGAEQRAVAVIWRDPEEDTADGLNGLANRTFVRFFKWLQ